MLTQEALVERAPRLRPGGGPRAARSAFTDECATRARAAEGCVKRQVAPWLDPQLVAFPQDGVLLRSKGAFDNPGARTRPGVEVVGGIPHFERTHGRRRRERCACCAN